MNQSAPKLPIGVLILNMLGSIALAAGVAGLFVPEAVPFLSSPAVAWALICVGLMLEIASVVQILAFRRRQQ